MNLIDQLKSIESQQNNQQTNSIFPLEILPITLQNYFTEANSTLDCNIDYMACSFLWGMASLIGNSCAIQAKSGWLEYANLWIACIGSAGVGKTPSMSMATRPFEKINAKLITSFPNKLKLWKETNDDPENEPKQEQFIVNDITIEALVALHSKNQNAIGMLREELDGWVKNMSRYSNGSDLPFWLSTWSGKAVSMNRKSGDSYLAKPFIPILGGVQPDILENFSTDENKANGFMDRILLCCPETKIELFNTNEMSQDAINWYDDFVNKMYRTLKAEIKKDENGEILPNVFKMDENAKLQWQKCYNEISLLQNSDDENEYMKSMLPKQKSYIPRFALLLHLANNLDNNNVPNLITENTILDAMKLSKYFIENAKKVKVSQKETKQIKYLVTNSENHKQAFFKILQDGKKINYTKTAEILDTARLTLYRWKKEFEEKK